jgi:tetratricopeptide (TPR) repeat protein
MDIGCLWLKRGNKDGAMENIEKAYLIYEVATETSIDKNYELLASSALLLGTINESKRRYKQALDHALKASDIYELLYGTSNKLHIESLWLVIKICFAMNMSKAVLDNCMKLLEHLNKEEGKGEMRKVKANSVAAIILISTKNLPAESKRKLFKLTQELFPENIEVFKLQSLNELELTEEAISFFIRLYDERRHQGIVYFYSTLIQQLCNLYNEIIEADDNEYRDNAMNESRKLYCL